MKQGDELQIKGSLGFLYNPVMVVVEVKDGMVLLEPKNAKKGGVLSHLNQSWHSIESIKKKLDRPLSIE